MITTRFVRDLAIVLAAVLVVASATLEWVARPWRVEGSSMEPTLRDGDRIIVDLWTYRRRSPEPNDVALLLGPDDEPLVKRVSAKPLSGRGGVPPTRFETTSPLEETLEVLGDRLEASSDSRAFGPVPRHRFLGRVVFRYWPVGSIGPIR